VAAATGTGGSRDDCRVQGLNKVVEAGSTYFYRGIDEVQKGLEEYPLVQRFLAGKADAKESGAVGPDPDAPSTKSD
jgi:hypothetical protein